MAKKYILELNATVRCTRNAQRRLWKWKSLAETLFLRQASYSYEHTRRIQFPPFPGRSKDKNQSSVGDFNLPRVDFFGMRNAILSIKSAEGFSEED